MSPIQFLVVRQGGKWSVRSQDEHRSFADQQAATRAAVDLANHSGKDGKPAVVIVELGKGRFETVWTYGEDALPAQYAFDSSRRRGASHYRRERIELALRRSL